MSDSPSILDQPVTNLSFSTITHLSANLSIEQEIGRRDWIGVAGVIGFNTKHIRLMQQHKESNKGWLLLTTWDDMGKSSLRLFIFALLELKMQECLDVLKRDRVFVNGESFEQALAEYDHLKSLGQVESQFPVFTLEEVSRVLYPQVGSRNLTETNPPRHEEPLSPTVTENLQRLALEEAERHEPCRERNSVYISYCPESNSKFNSQLSKFANVLRNQEYTVHFAPFCDSDIRLCGGLDRWKEMCINKSEDIIIICTQAYFNEDKKGSGSRRENTKIEVDSRLLRQIAYSADHGRLIPVMLDQFKFKLRKNSTIPPWLQAASVYKWPSCERELLFCLAKQPQFVLPAPTKKKELRPIVIDYKEARKHNPFK